MSSATPDPFRKELNRSISIGFLISSHLKKKLKFIDNSEIKTKEVGVTCETCSLNDCDVRVAEPSRLERAVEYKNIEKTVSEILNNYS